MSSIKKINVFFLDKTSKQAYSCWRRSGGFVSFLLRHFQLCNCHKNFILTFLLFQKLKNASSQTPSNLGHPENEVGIFPFSFFPFLAGIKKCSIRAIIPFMIVCWYPCVYYIDYKLELLLKRLQLTRNSWKVI